MRKPWLILLLGVAVGGLVSLPFRPRSASPTPQPAAEASLAERELERIIPKIDLDAVPFDEAVSQIQKLSKAEIVIDPAAFKAGNFNSKKPVTLHATELPLEDILELLTAVDAGAGPQVTPMLFFEPVGGQISLFPPGVQPKFYTSEIYDVRDLEPHFPRSEAQSPLFGLEMIIQTGIFSQDWKGAVGKSRVMEIGAFLYVTTTPRRHREIRKLLNSLRAPPAPSAIRTHGGSNWVTPQMPASFAAKLERPMKRFDLENVPFEDALTALGKMGGVTIETDWKTLDRLNFNRQTKISVHVRDTALPDLLESLLSQNISGAQLAFAPVDGFIRISSADEIDKIVEARVYDIEELLHGDGLPSRFWVGEELTRFVTDEIDPPSWQDHGGTDGRIFYYGGRLFVTQTWANQRRVTRALEYFKQNGIVPLPRARPAGDAP